ncbi:MAG: hypothetical protein K8S97_07185 [Anaerolineae bacterium]|nr:hypothetical protein [Anaerolineae bacterium]
MPTFNEFTAEDWARLERDWNAWWNWELDRPLVVLEGRPVVDEGQDAVLDDFMTRFPLDRPPDEVLDRVAPRVEATQFYGDAFPRWWVNFGAGIVAGFLGAQVEYETGTTWFHAPETPSLADIQPQFGPDNVWWQRVQAITRAAVARWGDKLAIGMTDLGGNMDILASLRGTDNLLLDLYDAPDEVERVSRAITQAWLQYYDELYPIIASDQQRMSGWPPVWFPGRGYMLQCDFAYMISPPMFERFVLPDLTACCDALDYGFYHLDGTGQLLHVDMLLEMDRLRGIQWVPGAGTPDASHWPELLRKIRDAGKLVQVFTDAEGALKIMQEVGGRGLMFVMQADFAIPPDFARDLLNALHAAG